jgi:AcrR family transcriptional regulator
VTAPARTQKERREATIGKLLDATVESLCEVGYARTTVNEVCTRAGVSPGGLFRHFPSRLDLIVAAADEVRRRQFAAFREGLGELDAGSIQDCLRLLRAACRAPINAVWYELVAVARTDAALRALLSPMAARYHREIAEFARTLPVTEHISPALLDTLLFTAVHALDGEALVAVVHPQPDQEELRLQLLERLLLTANASAANRD